MDAELVAQAHGLLEEQPRKARVVVVYLGVAGKKRMDSEVLDAERRQARERLLELLARHAELRVLRVADDAVGRLEAAAGVEPAADHARQLAAERAPEAIDHVEAVEVDDGAEVASLAVVLVRGVVAREHDVPAGDAAGLRERELGAGRAVAAAALLGEDAHDPRVGGGLHGEVLLEPRVPRERLVERTGAAANLRLVIEVERSGVLGADGLELLFAYEGALVHARVSLLSNSSGGRAIRRAAGKEAGPR